MQNQLININQNLTMSSREIAELTGKEHKNVLEDVRKLLAELDIQSADFTADYKDSKGRTYPMFNLPKRECLILVSGYSIALRAKIIDRWQELENQQAPKLPQTFSEALQLAADQAKQLELQAPKVAYFNALVDRNLLVNIRDSAKEIGIKQNEFVKWLLDNKYVYRDAREQLKPYAQYTPDLFELKEYVNPHNGQSGNQLLTTPRGRETFNLLINGAKQ